MPEGTQEQARQSVERVVTATGKVVHYARRRVPSGAPATRTLCGHAWEEAIGWGAQDRPMCERCRDAFARTLAALKRIEGERADERERKLAAQAGETIGGPEVESVSTGWQPVTVNGFEMLEWVTVMELQGYRTHQIAFAPLTNHTHGVVSVSQLVNNYRDRIWQRPTVDWMGMGEQGAGEAGRFAQAILYAAQVAQKWTQEYTGAKAGGGEA